MSTRAFADLGPAPGKWRGGVATVDGKIACVPFNASACLVIDPMSGTCSADHEAYSGLGDGPAKWSGAVLGADHKVYCTPCLSEHVLVLDLAAGTADCSTYTCEAFQRRRLAAEKTERDYVAHQQHLESSAESTLKSAKVSVEKLNKGGVTEIKSLQSPSEVVKKLFFAVLALIGHHKPDWSAVQKELATVNAFRDSLLGVDPDSLQERQVSAARQHLDAVDLTTLEAASRAAAKLAPLLEWANALIELFDITQQHKAVQLGEAEKSKTRDTRSAESAVHAPHFAATVVGGDVCYYETATTSRADETVSIVETALDSELAAFVDRRQPEFVVAQNAAAALDTLDKDEISILKALGKPPKVVQCVCEAVCCLKGIDKPDWKAAKRMVSDTNFMNSLLTLDMDRIQGKHVRAAKEYLKLLAGMGIDEPWKIKASSGACFGLMTWVVAIVDYCSVAKAIGSKPDETVSLGEPVKPGLDSELAAFVEQRQHAQTAVAALDTLDKKELGECKGMAKPPGGVDDVFAAIMVLLANAGGATDIACDKKGKPKDVSWKKAQLLMKDVGGFIERLKGLKDLIELGQVPKVNFENIRPYLALEHFTFDIIKKKSGAAAGCCMFVIAIVKYYDIVVAVEPKRQSTKSKDRNRADDCTVRAVDAADYKPVLKIEMASDTHPNPTTDEERDSLAAVVLAVRIKGESQADAGDYVGASATLTAGLDLSERWMDEDHTAVEALRRGLKAAQEKTTSLDGPLSTQGEERWSDDRKTWLPIHSAHTTAEDFDIKPVEASRLSRTGYSRMHDGGGRFFRAESETVPDHALARNASMLDWTAAHELPVLELPGLSPLRGEELMSVPELRRAIQQLGMDVPPRGREHARAPLLQRLGKYRTDAAGALAGSASAVQSRQAAEAVASKAAEELDARIQMAMANAELRNKQRYGKLQQEATSEEEKQQIEILAKVVDTERQRWLTIPREVGSRHWTLPGFLSQGSADLPPDTLTVITPEYMDSIHGCVQLWSLNTFRGPIQAGFLSQYSVASSVGLDGNCASPTFGSFEHALVEFGESDKLMDSANPTRQETLMKPRALDPEKLRESIVSSWNGVHAGSWNGDAAIVCTPRQRSQRACPAQAVANLSCEPGVAWPVVPPAACLTEEEVEFAAGFWLQPRPFVTGSELPLDFELPADQPVAWDSIEDTDIVALDVVSTKTRVVPWVRKRKTKYPFPGLRPPPAAFLQQQLAPEDEDLHRVCVKSPNGTIERWREGSDKAKWRRQRQMEKEQAEAIHTAFADVGARMQHSLTSGYPTDAATSPSFRVGDTVKCLGRVGLVVRTQHSAAHKAPTKPGTHFGEQPFSFAQERVQHEAEGRSRSSELSGWPAWSELSLEPASLQAQRPYDDAESAQKHGLRATSASISHPSEAKKKTPSAKATDAKEDVDAPDPAQEPGPSAIGALSDSANVSGEDTASDMENADKRIRSGEAGFAMAPDPRLKGVRQFQTQPQKRGQTADNWGQKKYEHKPLFDVRTRPRPFRARCLRWLALLACSCGSIQPVDPLADHTAVPPAEPSARKGAVRGSA